jgi:hypothetical protein
MKTTRTMQSKSSRAITKIGLASLIFGGGVAASFAAPFPAEAQDASRLRQEAYQELAPRFFNKSFSIEASLVSVAGPEFWEKSFGRKIEGCPAAPAETPLQSTSLEFTSGGKGPWAGSLDGINTTVTKPTGIKGTGFAVPSNSTARLPEFQQGPEFEFSFGNVWDVKRALVDQAADAFDRCASALPPGDYSDGRLSRLCGLPPVTRGAQGQTCIPSVSGTVYEKTAAGDGYRVVITKQTMCDFVGFGKEANTSTGFFSCFIERSEGIAKITEATTPIEAKTAVKSAVKSAAQRAMRVCKSSPKAKSHRKLAKCVNSAMTKSLSGKGALLSGK